MSVRLDEATQLPAIILARIGALLLGLGSLIGAAQVDLGGDE